MFHFLALKIKVTLFKFIIGIYIHFFLSSNVLLTFLFEKHRKMFPQWRVFRKIVESPPSIKYNSIFIWIFSEYFSWIINKIGSIHRVMLVVELYMCVYLYIHICFYEILYRNVIHFYQLLLIFVFSLSFSFFSLCARYRMICYKISEFIVNWLYFMKYKLTFWLK